MKKIASIGAAVAALTTSTVAMAQAAPTTLTGMADAVDFTDAKGGMLAAGSAVLVLTVLTVGFRYVKRWIS